MNVEWKNFLICYCSCYVLTPLSHHKIIWSSHFGIRAKKMGWHNGKCLCWQPTLTGAKRFYKALLVNTDICHSVTDAYYRNSLFLRQILNWFLYQWLTVHHSFKVVRIKKVKYFRQNTIHFSSFPVHSPDSQMECSPIEFGWTFNFPSTSTPAIEGIHFYFERICEYFSLFIALKTII